MKFTARDLNDVVSLLAPPELAYSWDNVGFQIGESEKSIRRVLCALEVTPRVIREARESKAQALLVHHPLIFHPLSSISDIVPLERVILEIVRARLCLIVAHTNLDKSPHGTNRALAELMGLKNLEFLEPEPGSENPAEFGMGYLGILPRPVLLKGFVASLKKRLSVKNVQLVGDPRKFVRSVAVLTGAGGDAIRGMNLARADVLLTGEINHHAALYASIAQMAVICAGHFATEIVGMNYFAGVLRRQDVIERAGVEILVAKNQAPPYQYY